MNDFNKRVSALVKERGFKNLEAVAVAIGDPRANFYNKLKYLQDNASFKSPFAKKLYEVLSISEKDFRRRVLEEEYDEQEDQNALDFLIDLINSLDAKDIFIQTLNRDPWEFSEEVYQRAVFGAFNRGAYITYMFYEVNNEELRMPQFCSYDNFHTRYNKLKVALSEIINKELDEVHALVKSFTLHNIVEFKTDDPFFSNPIHNYVLVKKNEQLQVLEEVYKKVARSVEQQYVSLPPFAENIILSKLVELRKAYNIKAMTISMEEEPTIDKEEKEGVLFKQNDRIKRLQEISKKLKSPTALKQLPDADSTFVFEMLKEVEEFSNDTIKAIIPTREDNSAK